MPRLPLILFVLLLLLSCISVAPCSAQKEAAFTPTVTSESVATDPDDPAIWVHPKNRKQSLILGTNKSLAKEGGALYVFDMNGKIKQVMGQLERPNNVDVEYGMRLKNGQTVDIAVVTERGHQRLHIYYIKPDGSGLKEAGNGVPVFEGETKESFRAPMGIALYKRPKDGAIFACVTRKGGLEKGYVWQYRLEDNGHGGITGTKVRELGNFSGQGEIEAIAVDDELGYVYYADENFGVHKWQADPDHPQAGTELAVFAKTGYTGDREGIGIYAQPGGKGYIVCVDQIDKNSIVYLYKREGEPGNPHDHSKVVKVIRKTDVDATDGIEVASTPMGTRFPQGMLIMMNSGPKNFLYFDWRIVKP